MCGPLMAHCISRNLVLQFDSNWDEYLPVSENANVIIYEWLPGYLNKMRNDLIAIGEWDCGSSM